MNVVITALDYLCSNCFDEDTFEHRDSRVMDLQQKISISVARRIYSMVKAIDVDSKQLGLCLICELGPIESIAEYHSQLIQNGYVGINPSKFPNIMTATLLSRIAIEIQAKGSCIPFLSIRLNRLIIKYVLTQINAGRCCAIMCIHLDKKNNCFGCFVETEESCRNRGLTPKFIISENDSIR